MEAKYSLFVILGLLVIIAPLTAHGQGYGQSYTPANKYSAVIKTSKTNFVAGESIVISGTVKPYDASRELQLVIRDSAQKIVVLKTVPVNSDATFSYSTNDTSKWQKGSYTALAQYGTSDVEVASTIFSFDPTKTAEPITAGTTDIDMKTKSTDVKQVKKTEKSKVKSDVKKQTKKSVKVTAKSKITKY